MLLSPTQRSTLPTIQLALKPDIVWETLLDSSYRSKLSVKAIGQ